MAAGVPILVHQQPSFMMNTKTAILDNKMVAGGNFNWNQHAIRSEGHVYMHKVFGPHRLKTDFLLCMDIYVPLVVY